MARKESKFFARSLSLSYVTQIHNGAIEVVYANAISIEDRGRPYARTRCRGPERKLSLDDIVRLPQSVFAVVVVMSIFVFVRLAEQSADKAFAFAQRLDISAQARGMSYGVRALTN